MEKANILLYDEKQSQLEPQSTSAVVIVRRMDPRERGWLPSKLKAPESYWVWRKRSPDLAPEPYYLPFDGPELPGSEDEHPHLIWSPWKGLNWKWADALVVGNGAIGWVGKVGEREAERWLPPDAAAKLPYGSKRGDEALRLLADMLIHS